MKVKWKKLLVILLAATLLVINIKAFADEAESRRFSILSISGTEAFLTRGAAKEVKAAAGMPVGQGSSIRTGTKTKMYLETDDSKTIRLDSKSEAEVSKSSAKLLKITLKSGSLFFNVDKPLQEDEEMTFDAAQTSMSIRGTSGIVTLNDMELVCYLLEGTVTWNLGAETITVSAGQKVTLKASVDQTGYQLQSIENFTWENLTFFGLESVFEQKDNLDLSAIHLTDQIQLEQAHARLVQEQAIEEASSENPRIIRMDVPKTRTRRNRGRGSVNNTSTVTPSVPPTAAPTEEETTAEATEPSTEESTAETTEAPTEETPSGDAGSGSGSGDSSDSSSNTSSDSSGNTGSDSSGNTGSDSSSNTGSDSSGNTGSDSSGNTSSGSSSGSGNTSSDSQTPETSVSTETYQSPRSNNTLIPTP